mmetsp:Transcript_28263/g.66953  ORF Transcript_28263/g.66953 Transcript_28263/m.66953 type:complete len:243 (-) Transcript_28263:442-1170(-)
MARRKEAPHVLPNVLAEEVLKVGHVRDPHTAGDERGQCSDVVRCDCDDERRHREHGAIPLGRVAAPPKEGPANQTRSRCKACSLVQRDPQAGQARPLNHVTSALQAHPAEKQTPQGREQTPGTLDGVAKQVNRCGKPETQHRRKHSDEGTGALDGVAKRLSQVAGVLSKQAKCSADEPHHDRRECGYQHRGENDACPERFSKRTDLFQHVCIDPSSGWGAACRQHSCTQAEKNNSTRSRSDV